MRKPNKPQKDEENSQGVLLAGADDPRLRAVLKETALLPQTLSPIDAFIERGRILVKHGLLEEKDIHRNNGLILDHSALQERRRENKE